MGVKMLLKVNKLFKLPAHPFNMSNDGKTTYAKWQYEQGERTIEGFLRYTAVKEMFQGKEVLDIGCGAGGKTMYYGNMGAKRIVGLEILEKYRKDALELAEECGLKDRFEFVCADAGKTGFESNRFDTIIMNDAMEHVAQPDQVLKEVYRILKPGGRLYVNFPPYDHPFGAHLQDVIGIPYVHRLFSEKTQIDAYKQLVADKPDGDERIRFRFSTDANGREYMSYINKMTIKWFHRLKNGTNFKQIYYYEEPIRSYVTPLAKIPRVKEFFIRMVYVILEK